MALRPGRARLHALADPRTGERGHYRGQRVGETACVALGEWALARIEAYLAGEIATALGTEVGVHGEDT